MKKTPVTWADGSQLDYFNTAANVIGYSNLPLAWGLSLVNWNSKDDLVQFVESLVYGSGESAGAA